MPGKNLMALYGRLGLVVVAFAFVAAIVAGPLLQKLWSTEVAVTERSNAPDLRLQAPSANATEEEQG